MKKNLIIGADGLIGRALELRLLAAGQALVCTNRAGSNERVKLDLSLGADSWPDLGRIHTAYLLAGKTALADCERSPDETRLINVTNTLALARRLGIKGAHIVYISTNLVFSGKNTVSHLDDPIEPQCRYAAEKAEVEAGLRAAPISASILRITKIAEGLEAIFGQWAAKLARGEVITPFSDLVAAPMPLADVVTALESLGRQRLDGTFHAGADRDFSYGDMATLLARHMGVSPELVRPVSSKEAGVMLHANPAHTVLDTGDNPVFLDGLPCSARASLIELMRQVCSPI